MDEVANEYFTKSIELYKIILGYHYLLLSDVCIDLGLAMVGMNKISEGINMILHRVNIDLTFYGTSHPFIPMDYYRLGLALSKTHHYAEAKNYFERAIEIDSVMYGKRHYKLANYYRALGMTMLFLSDPQLSKKYFNTAYAIDSKFLGVDHSIAKHDIELLACVDRWNHLGERILPIGSHENCKEEELFEAYKKENPIFRAKELEELALNALKEGDQKKASDYKNLAKIILSAYYKNNYEKK